VVRPTLVVASLMATRMRMHAWCCSHGASPWPWLSKATQHYLQLPHVLPFARLGGHGSTFGWLPLCGARVSHRRSTPSS